MAQRVILLALWLLVSPMLLAQTDLKINELFDMELKGATKVHLSGASIEGYHLSLFKSLTVQTSDKTSLMIEASIEKDVKDAFCHESNHTNGRLYYGLYQLSSTKKGINRYIFYRNNALKKGNDNNITLIYMEGRADIKQLRKTFTKH